MILTAPQCINSILHESEKIYVSLDVTHSGSYSLYTSDLKCQTRKKCLAVLTFVHLYSSNEKVLRAGEIKFCCLIRLSLG